MVVPKNLLFLLVIAKMVCQRSCKEFADNYCAVFGSFQTDRQTDFGTS